MMGIVYWILGSIAVIVFIAVTLLYRGKPYHTLYLALQDRKKVNKELYPAFGFWLFAGLGGSGKTISMVEYAYRMKQQYPKLLIASGIKSLKFADVFVESWEDVVNWRNPYGDEYGVLILFDEIQLTLDSNKWKKAPDNLLEYVSQQRKLHKHIIASSQVFNRVNIKLREQTNYIVECRNIANRWFFSSAFHTEHYSLNGDKKDEGQKVRKRAWRHNFVGTDEIRALYDTFETQVSLYADGGKKTIALDDIMKLADN